MTHKRKMPSITMHFGATRNEITVDGHVFDRNALDKAQFSTLRRMTVGALRPLLGRSAAT